MDPKALDDGTLEEQVMDIPEEFAGHSRGGRPFVYRSGPKRWWVDASAFRDQQRCFKTWNGALAYALRVVGESR